MSRIILLAWNPSYTPLFQPSKKNSSGCDMINPGIDFHLQVNTIRLYNLYYFLTIEKLRKTM